MTTNTRANRRSTVAVIGGGPGGLLTAYLLEHVYRAPVDVTIFEASDRTGGKIISRSFADAGAAYEAGAAELYDYSELGEDPLRELIEHLGLATYPMDGRAVFIGDKQVATEGDVGRVLGRATADAVAAFGRRARAAITPGEYYESDWQADNADPLARQSFDAMMNTVTDRAARHYIESAIHSDVATEPRHTSASYGLQNYLMNEPGYMRLYGIDGGLERLPRAIAARLSATVKLNARVQRVTATRDDQFRVELVNGEPAGGPFDYCVAALPNYWLPSVEWAGPTLAQTVREHHAHYDHPAHYLRVTLLFQRPFWRDVVQGSYFMLDAFGGCCVYDESSRCPDTPGAVGCLGWLIAGDAAVRMANLDDATLVRQALESLPEPLRHGKALMVDGRVHRWVGAVNGLPGGQPLQDPDERHCPDVDNHPNFFTVGDYLFDSTLNGVYDSADYVAAWIAEEETDAEPGPAATAKPMAAVTVGS